jgi:hypothetical protein
MQTKNRRRMHCAALLAIVLAAAPFHGPDSSSILMAAGQGLSVSGESLGAGAEATANEFEQFESALVLATTGGRGRCVCMVS